MSSPCPGWGGVGSSNDWCISYTVQFRKYNGFKREDVQSNPDRETDRQTDRQTDVYLCTIHHMNLKKEHERKKSPLQYYMYNIKTTRLNKATLHCRY